MDIQTHGIRKYPATSTLLASSAGLGWSTVSVELRSHGVSEAPPIVPPQVEICLVVAGNKDGLVRRTGGGLCQEAMPETGAIWLSPAGLEKGMAITAFIPQTMHLYLPAGLFDRLRDDFKLPFVPARSIRYLAGLRDGVIEQIGCSILSELAFETSTSRMFVETASSMLAARLLQKYCDGGVRGFSDSLPHKADGLWLRRVLDFIEANIEDEITLENLGAISGYSPFHFAHKFSLATGVSPSRYISRLRLENAMAQLAAGKLPLAEIALNARFSSQASFTRAFRRSTGMTPNQFRRRRL
jgi:AraC family transcriptional regulator